jgi:hypothetical protein
MNKTHALRFAAVFAFAAVALVAGVAGFNALVDPYAMYRSFELPGFNVQKPGIYQRVRLLKAYELRRLRPDAVVLGTSRSHIGMRPSHDGWDSASERRYNLAFDGATTKEMYHYLLHAHANQPLRQVVLGLDSYHPTFFPAFSRPDFDPSLLDRPGSALNLPRRLLADLRLLASIDTLTASWKTLRAQQDDSPPWLAADGQRLGDVYFHTVGGTFLSEGPRAYFEEIDKLEVGFQTEGLRPDLRKPAPAQAAAPATPPEETAFAYIGRIVAFCREQGIDLRIFITPSHVRQLEIAAAVGDWDVAAERGKRALVELLAQDAAAHPGARPFPLYDFTGYTAITTEALPARGSRAEMAHYWDSSHFKQNVGDLVLDRIFGVERRDRRLPDDFGVLLTAQTIEPALARIRADRAAYRAAHAAELAVIDGWVAESLGTRVTTASGAEPPRAAKETAKGQPGSG